MFVEGDPPIIERTENPTIPIKNPKGPKGPKEPKEPKDNKKLKEPKEPKELKDNGTIIGVECAEIDKILSYIQPDVYNCREIIYNNEILDILIQLDPNMPNYNFMDDACDSNTINTLKTLKKFTKKDGHNCEYKKKNNKNYKGRYYLNNHNKKDNASLQSLYSRVRRLLLNGQNKYIDMENAHINIIKNILAFMKVENAEDSINILNRYCDEREFILEEITVKFNTTRKIAKSFFLILLYGGSVNTWIIESKLSKCDDRLTDFMKDFNKCINTVKHHIHSLSIFKTFLSIEIEFNKKTKSKKELENSALAIFLQEIESKIASVIIKYCENKNIITRIIIHDGIVFEDKDGIFTDEFLKDIERCIFEELNLNIPLAYEDTQPNEKDIIWYQAHKQFLKENTTGNITNGYLEIPGAGGDVEACLAVARLNPGKYISCGEQRFIKSDNHLWISEYKEPKNFKSTLNAHIILANLIKKNPVNGNITYYSSSNSHKKACYDEMLNIVFVNNKNFYDDIILKSKGYIAFEDCIYSFVENRTYTYDEKPDIYFIQNIGRKFPVRNEENIKFALDNILMPIFNTEEKLKYTLHTIARAVAGYVSDKKWYNWMGLRNCGKSTLTIILENIFGCYVKTFNADNLLATTFTPTNMTLANSWLIQFMYCRFLISNEIKERDIEPEPVAKNNKKTINIKKNENIVIAGEMIKKLISGGKDKIDARAEYTKEVIKFTPQFAMALCSNSTPETNPKDAMKTLEIIQFNSVFVDAEDMDPSSTHMKLKDDNIEDYIHNYDYLDAIMFLIIDNFDVKRLATPDFVKLDTLRGKGTDENDVESFMRKNFINTEKGYNYKNGYLSKFLIDILADNGFNVGIKKFNQTMDILKIGTYDAKHTKALVENDKGEFIEKEGGGYYDMTIKPEVLPIRDLSIDEPGYEEYWRLA